MRNYYFFIIKCCFIVLFLSQQITAKEFCPPGQLIEYSKSADTVVVEYHVNHTILTNQDPIPFMRIHGDGLVKVHYPIYMTKAGDYEYRLTEDELNILINTLDTNCVLSFDKKEVKEKIKQAKSQQEIVTGQRILTYRSDPSITNISVNLSRYTNSSAEEIIKTTNNRSIQPEGIKASWENINQSASENKNITKLQGLANAHNMLEALTKSSKLKKVR